MSTSKQTMTQVRDILRKLDRSIDDARAKRLSHPRAAVATRSITDAPSPRPAHGGLNGDPRHHHDND